MAIRVSGPQNGKKRTPVIYIKATKGEKVFRASSQIGPYSSSIRLTLLITEYRPTHQYLPRTAHASPVHIESRSMRPSLLDPLFADLSGLGGVGSTLTTRLENLIGGHRVLDLLMHLPLRYRTRRRITCLHEARDGEMIILPLRVSHMAVTGRGGPLRVHGTDAEGPIVITWFRGSRRWLEEQFPIDSTRVVSGEVRFYRGLPTLSHPDYVVTATQIGDIPRIEPIYPLTQGLSQRVLARIQKNALARIPDLPEWLPVSILTRRQLPSFRDALTCLHQPDSIRIRNSHKTDAADTPEPPSQKSTEQIKLNAALETARFRLGCDEVFGFILGTLASRRVQRSTQLSPCLQQTQALDTLRAHLPFALTPDQEQALAEITQDLGRSQEMRRLVQGDTGSGKSILALFAMAIAAGSGFQATLLAPTTLLAQQHGATLAPLAMAAGFRLAVLTGRESAGTRTQILRDLASGELPLVVGTHALLQADVRFARLGLAVIDEQHRFGVEQRQTLLTKGMIDSPPGKTPADIGLDSLDSGPTANTRSVHLLLMTATPIPRSLAYLMFGNVDVSSLHLRPNARSTAKTRVLPISRVYELNERISRRLQDGQLIYWVCPRIGAHDPLPSELLGKGLTADRQMPSEEPQPLSAEERFADLHQHFGDRVILVHGRMSEEEKAKAIARFCEGGPERGGRLLVATSVIEVGIDVPEARIMVIEQAERFGLAQLHQLRGRVGRGKEPGIAVLLRSETLSSNAHERLKILRNETDGFRIAELDLQLRGPGDILGVRQSGSPEFRVREAWKALDEVERLRKHAQQMVERSHPTTDQPPRLNDHKDAAQLALHLFRRHT